MVLLIYQINIQNIFIPLFVILFSSEEIKIYKEKSEINIKKVKLSDVSSLADIDAKHNSYYKDSPIFMPVQEEDPISHLTEWLGKENHHMWMAYRK